MYVCMYVKKIRNMVKEGDEWKRTGTKDEDQDVINCYLVYAKEKNATNGKKGCEGTSFLHSFFLCHIQNFTMQGWNNQITEK